MLCTCRNSARILRRLLLFQCFSAPLSTSSRPSWLLPISSSSVLVQSKSSFQAFTSRLPRASKSTTQPSHDADIVHLISYLSKTVPRTTRATHAMWAWRSTTLESDVVLGPVRPGIQTCSGSHDGGENGAGQRLERLLEMTRCDDVALVVFRWYGGVQLGSQRWKCISTVAKEALEDGGFMGSKLDGAVSNEEHRKAPARAGKRRKK